jgi:hypothetical protein
MPIAHARKHRGCPIYSRFSNEWEEGTALEYSRKFTSTLRMKTPTQARSLSGCFSLRWHDARRNLLLAVHGQNDDLRTVRGAVGCHETFFLALRSWNLDAGITRPIPDLDQEILVAALLEDQLGA